LRFAAGFEDPNFCPHGHWLYVFEGSFELEFEESIQRLEPGQACTIDVGTPHKARNAGSDDVVLLIWTELAPP
jgi:mannose-6-phosphate isomerase-like protein (cupin superfamily)